MNDRNYKLLIDSANELLNKFGDGQKHTVAAAAFTKSGKVLKALNVSHFTGGSCAEIALLAKLISEGEQPLMIAAVGDQGRGVLASCGKCRQIYFDYYPDTQVVISNDGKVQTVRDLLPNAYSWFNQQTVTE